MTRCPVTLCVIFKQIRVLNVVDIEYMKLLLVKINQDTYA